MANSKNYNFYKPEKSDKFAKIGYGVGEYDKNLGKSDFVNKFEKATADKTLPMLSKSEYETTLGTSKLDLVKTSSSCLKKELITDEISSATNKIITSKPCYDLYNDFYKQLKEDNNGNYSIKDKLFVKITKDISNKNVKGLNTISYNSQVLYFIENDASATVKLRLTFKRALNQGKDTIENTNYYGENMVCFYSSHYSADMYYSVYDNRVYVGDNPTNQTIGGISISDRHYSRIHCVADTLFISKWNDANEYALSYSLDGYTFKTIDFSSYGFKTEGIKISYYNGWYIVNNRYNQLVILDDSFNIVKQKAQSITINGSVYEVRTDYMYSESKNEFFVIVLLNDKYYMAKTTDFDNFVIDVESPFNNAVELAGCIFSMDDCYLYIYNENNKKFLKVHYFNRGKLSYYRSDTCISFNKNNNCPVAQYYLFKDDIKSLSDIVSDLNDKIV